jgi:peptide/nickel transport system substrate-binding protein
MVENYWTRRLRRRGLLGTTAAGGLGIAGLALVGCGDDSTSKPAVTAASGGASPSAASSSPSAAAASASAAPTAVDLSKLSEADLFKAIPNNPPKDWQDSDIKTGGTFIRMSNRPAPTMDPMATVTGGTSDVTTPVYSSILRLPTNQGQPDIYATSLEGNLATAWEQPDNLTLVLTLAPNIKWQNVAPLNGRAFTADDIKYSFNRGLTNAKSVMKANYTNIDKVEDAGGGKVKISLKKPNAATPLMLGAWTTLVVPPELGDSPDINTKAVGTGPFIIDHITPNVEVVFKKNPDYFKKDKSGRALPYIDGYTISYITDPATITATFEGGKADFWYATASPVNGITELKNFVGRNPKVVYEKTQGVYGAFSFIPHAQKPPFNDIRVRRALSVAFDRQTVLDTLYKNQGLALNYFHWPSALTKPPTLADMGQWYKYDPATAKQLLSAAGYANGLTVDMLYNYPEVESETLIFQQNAAAAGIKLNLVKTPDVASLVASYLKKDWKDMVVVGRGFNYPDVNEFMSYYTPADSPTNYSELNDPDLTALFNKQMELTGNERRAVHKQIWDKLLDQVYETTLPSSDGINFWQPTLKNWVVMTWPSNAGAGSAGMDAVWRKG